MNLDPVTLTKIAAVVLGFIALAALDYPKISERVRAPWNRTVGLSRGKRTKRLAS